MSDPFISTIIPTHNRARDVVRAVESALGQTYPPARQEIIVVDDGSTDGGATEAALARFGRRIRYVRKENGGVSSARNFGMAQARGELFAFLDSDDEWLPEKLARQVTFLATRPHVGLTLTDFVAIDGERRPKGRSYLREGREDEHPNLLQALRAPSLPPSLVLVRRSVVDDVGPFDATLKTAEDIDFHLRVARRWGIAVIDEPLARYKMGHADGLSHGRGTYADFMGVISRFLVRHSDEISPSARDEVLLTNYVRNARGLIVSGWYADGVRFALQGARHVRGLDDALALAGLGMALFRNAASRSVRRLLPG
jgi:glycosyltransferase involved in cell wall biosynthesis